jgi:predicted  nucleic acid-binding Zn-ribbon protein
MGVLDDLLAVQVHDTATDALRRRREKLPVRAAITSHEAQIAALLADSAPRREARDALARQEKALDDEAKSLEAKAADMEKRLYSGAVSSPRELQAMQADVDSLRRHRRDVEDRELELLVEREALDEELADVTSRREQLESALARHRTTLGEEEAAIDADLATEAAARAALAAGIPPDLLAQYERIRVKNHGIGAGKLVGNTCQGCHLALPAVEVDRARKLPPDEVVLSSTCGCILVR